MDNFHTYDAQADTIKLEDIATNEDNRIVLRRIRYNKVEDEDDSHGKESLWIQKNSYGYSYVPEGEEDMGRLGYYVGKNTVLQQLYISIRKI